LKAAVTHDLYAAICCQLAELLSQFNYQPSCN